MEAIIDTQHGAGVLLVGVVIILSLHLFMNMAKFLFELLRKKEETKEKNFTEVSLALRQNTEAVRELRIQLGILEREISEMQKLKINVNRLFGVVKIIAGPKWPDIKKRAADDDIK